MFSLSKLFGKNKGQAMLTRDQLAEILKTTPDALDAFEKSYTESILDAEPDMTANPFHVNSKQASALRQEHTGSIGKSDIINAIVDELLAQTKVYTYCNGKSDIKSMLALPPQKEITQADLDTIPLSIRPQLSGSLMQCDMNESSAQAILWYYKEYMNSLEKNDNKYAQIMYHHFRQGLDILDLDPITYAMIDTNQNSMGHWLPQLADAVVLQDFFKIPNTTIAKLPITLLQLTRLDYHEMTPMTIAIVNEFCKRAFNLDENQSYFIKTGTYSSKFDFRNAKVTGAKEVNELGEYLLYIHFQALQMASPLCSPSMYGVSTTNEWVVREFIEDSESNPCIYKGMPLHTEYRVFVDFDDNTILGINPYWDPTVMKNRFGNEDDSDKPDNVHDYVIYSMHEETLMARYNQNKDLIQSKLHDMLANINLTGQWSIDIMQNGEDFYIIDMALAENSALNQCVPKGKLKHATENWLPNIERKALTD